MTLRTHQLLFFNLKWQRPSQNHKSLLFPNPRASLGNLLNREDDVLPNSEDFFNTFHVNPNSSASVVDPDNTRDRNLTGCD